MEILARLVSPVQCAVTLQDVNGLLSFSAGVPVAVCHRAGPGSFTSATGARPGAGRVESG